MPDVEIRVRGLVDRDWSTWAGGLAIVHTADGETTFVGSVKDQSALYGLIERLSGLGLQLVSVTVVASPAGKEGEDVKRVA